MTVEKKWRTTWSVTNFLWLFTRTTVPKDNVHDGMGKHRRQASLRMRAVCPIVFPVCIKRHMLDRDTKSLRVGERWSEGVACPSLGECIQYVKRHIFLWRNAKVISNPETSIRTANHSIASSEIFNSLSHACEVGMGFAFLVNGIRIPHMVLRRMVLAVMLFAIRQLLCIVWPTGVRHSTFRHGIAQYSICLNGVCHWTNSVQDIDQLGIRRVWFAWVCHTS